MNGTRTSEIKPVILCGGAGTRLWPLSTEFMPKPFLPLVTDRTMLIETAARFESTRRKDLDFASPNVVGSVRHEAAIRAMLPKAGLILEPRGRNSGPAVAAAALCAPPKQLLLILPADHHIADIDAFHEALAAGMDAAAGGELVTFAIKPDRPATEYGYLQADGAPGVLTPVIRFVEKPDAALAKAYLESGEYFWNSGIFLAAAGALEAAFETHAPDILRDVRRALVTAGPLEPGEIRRLQPAGFARCRAESFDYAVMESASGVSTVPVDMGWSDIGDHAALYNLKRGASDLVTEGAVFTRDTTGCLIRSDGPVIAVRGVSDLAIVANRHGVLVTPLNEAAFTKPLAVEIAARGYGAVVGDQMAQRVRDWLFNRCLPFWADRAWDSENGGFVESVALDGEPNTGLQRRGRVAPRQIFAFARAMTLGWTDPRAERLVTDGLDFLDTRARSSRGGWASLLDPVQGVVDDTPRLYDQAFVILAGAWAFRATGAPLARALAEEALDFVERELCDPVHGGYFETPNRRGARRSNPHMHMLEATLALYQVTGEQRHLQVAERIALLFETRFFDPATGALTEYFEADWSRATDAAGRLSEPGHCYEWAALLASLEDVSGRDLISWRRRLINFADRAGRADNGFAVDAVDIDGTVLKGTQRLWPQLEMFRGRLFHPETAAPGAASQVLDRLFQTYFADGPDGGWMDCYDEHGRAASTDVPASMVYHMLTAFSTLCWASGEIG